MWSRFAGDVLTVVCAAVFIFLEVNWNRDIFETVLLFCFKSCESTRRLFLFVFSTTDGGKF
jgi:hypothetical protein